ncbi:MAG: hypothetical protein WKF71_04500 [Pyrinomonadaceae bacterium]
MNKLKLSLALTVLIVGLGGTFALVTNVVEAHTRTVKIKSGQKRLFAFFD